MKPWKSFTGKELLIKSALVSSWILFILLFLYMPNFFSELQTQKTINILVWPQIIDGEFLKEFEEKNNIKVNISYFENNEELLAKLRNSHQHDYDIIMPSDFMLNIFIKEEWIKEIDKTKLTFWDNLVPEIKGNKADIENSFTIPCFWAVLGIGIDTRFINMKHIPQSWALLFKERNTPHIGMLENMRQLFSITALYLFNKTGYLTKEEAKQTIEKLTKQKKQVVAYSEMRIEYMLASGSAPVTLCLSSDIAKMIDTFEYISFFVPEEGSFSILDSFCITKSTKKDDLVYAFLNYIYQPHIMEKYKNKFCFPSPLISVKNTENTVTHASLKHIPIHSFQQNIDTATLQKFWIQLHAA